MLRVKGQKQAKKIKVKNESLENYKKVLKITLSS